MNTGFPFSVKSADGLSIEDMINLFEEPPIFYERLLQPINQALLGGPGVGKTMILRSSTLPVLSKRIGFEKLQFLSVYIPFDYYSQMNSFCQAFRRYEKTDLFEDYFVNHVLTYLIKDFRGHIDEDIFEEVVKIIRRSINATNENVEKLTEELVGRNRAIGEHVRKTNSLIPEPSISYEPSTIEALLDLLKDIHRVLIKSEKFNHPICLMIDGYESFDDLSSVVNTLIHKEYNRFLCCKLGGLRLDGLHSQDKNNRPLNLGVDIEIEVIEPNVDSVVYKNFLIEVANRNLKRYVDNVSITEFLSSEPPEIVSKRISNPEDISPNLKILDGDGSKNLPDQRKWAYFGIDAFIKVSSGNVREFLRLLYEAFNTAKEKNRRPLKISSKSQATVISDHSKIVYESDIPERCQEFGLAIQSLVDNLCKKQLMAGFKNNELEGMQIQIVDPEELHPYAKDALRKGFQSMVLQCSKEDRKLLEHSISSVPSTFFICRTLAPKYYLSYNNEGALTIKADEIYQLLNKRVPGQPGYSPLYTKPAKDTDQAILMHNYFAFLSTPLLESSEGSKVIDEGIKRLKKAVKEIIKARLGEEIQNVPGSEIVIDPLDVEMSKGNFVKNVTSQINFRGYVIHDITKLSPGVAFEIGLSIGYEKPFFLVWNIDKRPFQSSELVDLINKQHVYQGHFSPGSDHYDYGKIKIMARKIDDIASKFNGKVKCPDNWGSPCKFTEIDQPFHAAYIEIQPRHREVERLVNGLIRNYGLRKMEKSDYPTGCSTSLCKVCYAIHRAKVCIVDATAKSESEEDLRAAMLLGIAHALWPHANIKIFDSTVKEQLVTMHEGEKCEWTPSTMDDDILHGSLSDFMDRLQRDGKL